ncbi:hypothetical protein K4A83_01215 [Spirulina subsalsa FACHB-351]|uniref:Uncharacterized protein n=1 Tax=Spirulina subsalsa FACHB-351 TaxID=234711 RepID=A0ABT3L071_9CYAN|nr:hypothetical protein [Spirulina subsalsa]MCW6034896.1 hypothetical protein [Spirulina subsalsa FACHB-351]
MTIQHQLIPGAIFEILASVAQTGTLTLTDRYGLLAAIMEDNLTEEERRAVDRLLRSVQRGRVRVAIA